MIMQYAVNVVFTKSGEMKYISHLDLLRLLGRALRRAGIPFATSQGFSKHPRISIERALKLGVESENEKAEFILREDIPADVFKERMRGALPDGIRIKDAAVRRK